jgi:hypothetical protein
MSIEGSFETDDRAALVPSMQLVMIPKEHVGRVLPMVVDKLEDVAERSRGRLSVPGMLDQFATGRWQMWIIWDASAQAPKAVFGTEIYRELSDLWICGVRFLTGEDSGQWLYLVDQLEEWARANGCSRLDIVARKGWAKKLPDYKLTHVLLEKDL